MNNIALHDTPLLKRKRDCIDALQIRDHRRRLDSRDIWRVAPERVPPLDILYWLGSSRGGVARCPCGRPYSSAAAPFHALVYAPESLSMDMLTVSRVRTLFGRAAGTRFDSRHWGATT